MTNWQDIYLKGMRPWTEQLDNYFFMRISEDYSKGECVLRSMGWTSGKWDEPIEGAMQTDFNQSLMADQLEDADADCKVASKSKKDPSKIDGSLFMRYIFFRS